MEQPTDNQSFWIRCNLWKTDKMATPEENERVVRELLVVKLYSLQQAKENLMDAHRSFLKRSQKILVDYSANELRRHTTLGLDPSNKVISGYLIDIFYQYLLYFHRVMVNKEDWELHHNKIKRLYLNKAWLILSEYNKLGDDK